jgi:hypothetical protein
MAYSNLPPARRGPVQITNIRRESRMATPSVANLLNGDPKARRDFVRSNGTGSKPSSRRATGRRR